MTAILILRPNAVNKKANLNIQPGLCRHSHSAVLIAQTSLRNCFILRLHEYLINQLTSQFSILIHTALQWLVPFIYLPPRTHARTVYGVFTITVFTSYAASLQPMTGEARSPAVAIVAAAPPTTLHLHLTGAVWRFKSV